MYSMTGFGRGFAQDQDISVQADLRSVNHRFLEVQVRGLGDFPLLAHRCEMLLRGAFARGSLDLNVRWEWFGEARPKHLNLEAAKRYLAELHRLRDELRIDGEPKLFHLIQLGVFQEAAPSEEKLWPVVEQAVEGAVASLRESRAAEGERMSFALAQDGDALAALIAQANELWPAAHKEAERRLKCRLDELSIALDPGRLEMELALWAERSDVGEELARLSGHLERFRELISAQGPVGRELEFLAQEIGREAGTLSAKARGVAMGKLGLSMRLVAERIREQARNIE